MEFLPFQKFDYFTKNFTKLAKPVKSFFLINILIKYFFRTLVTTEGMSTKECDLYISVSQPPGRVPVPGIEALFIEP